MGSHKKSKGTADSRSTKVRKSSTTSTSNSAKPHRALRRSANLTNELLDTVGIKKEASGSVTSAAAAAAAAVPDGAAVVGTGAVSSDDRGRGRPGPSLKGTSAGSGHRKHGSKKKKNVRKTDVRVSLSSDDTRSRSLSERLDSATDSANLATSNTPVTHSSTVVGVVEPGEGSTGSFRRSTTVHMALEYSKARFEQALPSKYRIGADELDIKRATPLGAGITGTVYRTVYRESTVAFKKINTKKMTLGVLEDFLREAQLLLDLKPHPNVLRLVGICVDPDLIIVTEYAKRGSLSEVLGPSGKGLSLGRKLAVLRDVAAGMVHLAEENVLHQDLAARNVLLDESYRALVADFGLSRIITQYEDDVGADDDGAGVATLSPVFATSHDFLSPVDSSAKADSAPDPTPAGSTVAAAAAVLSSSDPSAAVAALSSSGHRRASRKAQPLHHSSKQTKRNATPLAVKWMPPEKLAGGDFVPLSDVWSFGVLIIEVLTEKIPLPGIKATAFYADWRKYVPELLLQTAKDVVENLSPDLPAAEKAGHFDLFSLAKDCLRLAAGDRPYFPEIARRLRTLVRRSRRPPPPPVNQVSLVSLLSRSASRLAVDRPTVVVSDGGGGGARQAIAGSTKTDPNARPKVAAPVVDSDPQYIDAADLHELSEVDGLDDSASSTTSSNSNQGPLTNLTRLVAKTATTGNSSLHPPTAPTGRLGATWSSWGPSDTDSLLSGTMTSVSTNSSTALSSIDLEEMESLLEEDRLSQLRLCETTLEAARKTLKKLHSQIDRTKNRRVMLAFLVDSLMTDIKKFEPTPLKEPKYDETPPMALGKAVTKTGMPPLPATITTTSSSPASGTEPTGGGAPIEHPALPPPSTMSVEDQENLRRELGIPDDINFACVSRSEAENWIYNAPISSYLLRPSTANPGQLTLSFRRANESGKVLNVLVKQLDDGTKGWCLSSKPSDSRKTLRALLLALPYHLYIKN